MKLEDLQDYSVFLYDPSRYYTLDRLKDSHTDFKAGLPDELEKDRKKVLRYIILAYDINTPLRRMFPVYLTMKKEAAVMAGFKIDKKMKKFDDAVEDMIVGQDAGVNKMIVRYVMYFYNHKYLQLVVFNEVMGQLALQKMGTASFNTSEIKGFNEIGESIEKLTNEIFGGNESRELKKELHKLLEGEIEDLRPDIMAREVNKNPDLFKDMDKWLQ